MVTKTKNATYRVTRVTNRTGELNTNQRLYFHRYKLTNEQYHAIETAVSSSALKDLYQCKNPKWCYEKYINKTVTRKETEAMKIGTATHVLILEPRIFNKQFAVWDGGRKAGSAWNEFKCRNDDKSIISQEQYDEIKAMRDAVFACPEAAQLLSGGEAEQSVFWRDQTGTLCRARADYVKFHKGTKILIDLKTCISAEPEEFARSLIKLGYPIQEAHYREGFSRDEHGNEIAVTFAFIAVEKTTHTVQVYTLDEGFDEAGHFMWRQTLDKWAQYLSDDHWPSYADGVTELKAPDWWLNKILCYD